MSVIHQFYVVWKARILRWIPFVHLINLCITYIFQAWKKGDFGLTFEHVDIFSILLGLLFSAFPSTKCIKFAVCGMLPIRLQNWLKLEIWNEMKWKFAKNAN